MIAQIWRGAVRKQDGNAYARYMQDTGLAGYTSTPGNRGVWILRRDVGEKTEFLMFTLWDSLDAIKHSRARTTKLRSSIPRTIVISSSAS
jgi:heme-degrading monooxygenase HmoA